MAAANGSEASSILPLGESMLPPLKDEYCFMYINIKPLYKKTKLEKKRHKKQQNSSGGGHPYFTSF